jgi:lipoic acid synthetase
MVREYEPRPRTSKPPWLKQRIPSGGVFQKVRKLLEEGGLHTVCQQALCPNLGECFSRGTATFLILGDRCTRNCRFCAVAHGPKGPPDPDEPRRVAEAVQQMGLRYVVVTSVTRDDLPDGGAGHFAETIRAIRDRIPAVRIEVLIPDFQGDGEALATVLKAGPHVVNHNVETVPRLYALARPEADYNRSLGLLEKLNDMAPRLLTKTGLMLGLGESPEEVRQVLSDLLQVDCRLLTLGQYLRPSREHLEVARYVPPEEFEDWRRIALEMGFTGVASGPLVRSSFHAETLYETCEGISEADSAGGDLT